MTERARLVEKMAVAIRAGMLPKVTHYNKPSPEFYAAADMALRVIESPPDPAEKPSRICTCGQSGYPENSPYSNHPHTSDCPQYTEK